MKIVVTSVLVDDQDKALRFYTEMLGFRPKEDVPLGEHRWLTVVSPLDPNGVELVLEPDAHPAAKPFKAALLADGIPFTSFGVNDVKAEHERLVSLGVRFTQPPVAMGPVTTAVFDDTSAISSRSHSGTDAARERRVIWTGSAAHKLGR
jgi:catechol 2,3-dioxygenase-like lactoylglutathione lyase family enzyme